MHVRRNHDIRPARLKTLPRPGQHLSDDRQLGIGFRGQSVHQREQRLGGHQRFGHQRQMGFPAARQRFGIGRELIRRFQQYAAALQQHPPNVGEFCSMTGTVKEHNIQLLFQLLHGIAQGRRNAPQFICRRGKTAAPVNRVHDAKRLKRQCSLFSHLVLIQEI